MRDCKFLENNIVSLPVHGPPPLARGSNRIEIEFSYPKNDGYKIELIDPKQDTNLKRVFKDGKCVGYVLLPRVEIDIVWDYIPVTTVAFDINMDNTQAMTLSEPIDIFGTITNKIARPTEALELQNRISRLNKRLGDKLNRKERNKIRDAIKRYHRKHVRIWTPYIQEILQHVRDKQGLFCIDDLSCGADSGTFGQDAIVEASQQLCEDTSTPFVLVETPYTSKMCHICLQLGNRPDPDTFICLEHGIIDGQENGAKVIAQRGMRIWEIGAKLEYHERKELAGLIKPVPD
jgi:transposase